MIDSYTIILWASANENNSDMQVQQVFNILTLLNSTDSLKPKYLTVRKKKDANEFELTLENVKSLIINKRDKQFPDLGSTFSFFTSLDDNESAGISITSGVSNPRFQNTLVIDINTDIKKENANIYDDLANVFKNLIKVFRPFYGCMAGTSNRNMFGGLFNNEKKIPNSTFDLNYWNNDIVNKLCSIHKCFSKVYEFEKINNGYYIRLQKEPVDVSNICHIELQEQVNELVGIGKLHSYDI